MTAVVCDLTVEVTEVRVVARDVRSFRLAPVVGSLPPFSAGSHVVVALPCDGGARRNAYSLIGAPWASDAYTIAVRRESRGRGGSRFLHEQVAVGTRLAISRPRNAFPLVGPARHHLFVAGGIGITPFVAMAAQVARDGGSFDLHYALRDGADAAFADDLRAAHGGRVRLYRGDRGERLDLDALVRGRPLGTHLYVCGPNRLIEGAYAAARAAHWPESHLHCEVFAPPATGAPFRVALARSGGVIEVEADDTLLDALEAAGVAVEAMCRGGACGACETAIVACDGTILHADHWLTPEQRARGDRLMPCVSRFAGRTLVLDL